jgi:potassium efflux system protein
MHTKWTAFVILAVVLSGLSLCCPTSASAQETELAEQAKPAVDHGEPAPELTMEQVDTALAAIESNSGLDDALKSTLRLKYQQAIDALNAGAEFAAEAMTFADALESAPDQAAALDSQLQGLEPVAQAADIEIPGDTEELRDVVDSQSDRLTSLKDALSKVNAELGRITGRRVEAGERLPEAESELAKIREALKLAAEVEVDESPLRTAERIELQATQIQLSNEIEMLKQEQRSQTSREKLLETQRKLLERQVENATAAVNTADRALRERLMTTAERIRIRIDGLLSDLPDDDPEVQMLASEVQELSAEFEAAIQSAAHVKAAQDDVSRLLAGLQREYTSIQEQLSLGSGGRVMIQLLMELDAQCRKAPQKLARRPVPPLDQTRLQSIQVRDKIERQEVFEQRFKGYPDASVEELIEVRRELLTELDRQYENLVPAVWDLQEDQREFLSLAEEIHEYITEQLFGYGVKSCPPISVQTFRDLPAGVGWLLHPDHWLEIGRALGGVLSRLPFRSLGVLLLLATLLCLRPRIRTNLERAGVKTRRISTDRYAFTGEALGWTLLLAIPLPALVAYLAWGLGQDPSASDWMRGLTNGLEQSATILAAAAFTSAVLLPGGLGSVHFGWQQDRLDQFRRAIFSGLVVCLPAMLLTYACFLGEAADYFDSLGRISMIVALAWVTWVTYRLSAALDGVFPPPQGEERSRFLNRWRRLWFPVLLLCPLALAVLAMMGYLLTAVFTSYGFLLSLAIIAGGEIVHGLARRWFTIKQRKLALAEALERRRARQEATNEANEPEAASEIITIDHEDDVELDLEEVTDQARQLLRVSFSLGILLAVVYFWSHTFAVFEVLEAVELPLTKGLNALQVIQAVLIAIVTYVAVRNLPGLLELAVLRATDIDAGTRHAIYTLCQYGVIGVGMALLLGVLQVDWAKFGWIAAALSVGLGFGLQEVVANFVCGLILLFERPIRVGDVVTVEGVTGTVTRIHLRATTITNWDRQEFVVPNKTLITSTLLNWTLSAPLNRVVIPVGIAYGSDTDLARQILLEVAAAHPLILDDPPPMATFEQFADSSLNLTLRCFLPDMDNRLGTITELHSEIHKRFAEAGIEIAFPQQDLHLRSGWGPFRENGGDARGNG